MNIKENTKNNQKGEIISSEKKVWNKPEIISLSVSNTNSGAGGVYDSALGSDITSP